MRTLDRVVLGCLLTSIGAASLWLLGARLLAL